MKDKAFLDWFIGNKRVYRRETQPDHACMYFQVGECRQFKGKMYEIISIKNFYPSAFVNDKKPYVRRAYLRACLTK